MSDDRPSRFGLAKADLRYYAARRRWVALARALHWTLLRGHYSELCQDCGRRYLLWWCESDDLFIEVTDAPWARGRNGCRLGGGLYCPSCFDRRAESKGYGLERRPRVAREPAFYHGELHPGLDAS